MKPNNIYKSFRFVKKQKTTAYKTEDKMSTCGVTYQAIAEARSSTRTSRCTLYSTWAGPRAPRVECGTTPRVSRAERRLRILEGDGGEVGTDVVMLSLGSR